MEESGRNYGNGSVETSANACQELSVKISTRHRTNVAGKTVRKSI